MDDLLDVYTFVAYLGSIKLTEGVCFNPSRYLLSFVAIKPPSPSTKSDPNAESSIDIALFPVMIAVELAASPI